MKNSRAQVSIEYLAMVGLGIVLATVAILLALNLFSVKNGLKHLLEVYRNKTLQLG